MLYARMIALLLAASCAHQTQPWCTTRCGVQLVGEFPKFNMPSNWSCEEMQLAEDLFLERFSDMFPTACRDVASYLYFASTEAFMHGEEEVAGLAVCMMAQVQLSSLPPERSAYAHEMVHLVQGCRAPAPADKGRDDAHSNWDRDGIQGRLDAWELAMKERKQ